MFKELNNWNKITLTTNSTCNDDHNGMVFELF